MPLKTPIEHRYSIVRRSQLLPVVLTGDEQTRDDMRQRSQPSAEARPKPAALADADQGSIGREARRVTAVTPINTSAAPTNWIQCTASPRMSAPSPIVNTGPSDPINDDVLGPR